MKNGVFYIILTCLLLTKGFAQKADLAFKGNREKTAQFVHSKNDFDSIITHFFVEPSVLAIASDYKISLGLKLTIDTVGKVTAVKFDDFQLASSLMIGPDSPEGAKVYQAIRDSIRKAVYKTNGLWLCKLIKNKKEKSDIIVTTSIRKRTPRVFNESAEEQITNNKIYYYSIGPKKSNPDFFYNYGVKLINENKPDLAKIYFQEVISVAPDDIDAYFNLAMCHKNMGDMEGACKYWDKCFLLGDNKALDIIQKNCGNQSK